MSFIKNFSELGKGDAAIAGGKGASLGEMTGAGMAVPPGFVILADAFEKFLDATDLNTEIDTILHTVKTDEMRSVEHASEKIQKLILDAKMPADIGEEIQKSFVTLDSQFVAVRSSATAEDSNSAAWAGQLDTFLNTTKETLLENVQKCWASLFTARAVFYRFEKELHQQKISVAVVVQKMIQSEISGIAFSVHPVTEDRNQLIIEAGWGLGEAIVSGQITPDSYVVEKTPRRILDTAVANQERGIYRASKGDNEWRDIPEEKREQQKLSEAQILELAELVIKIEKHYAFPCDIEWALESGKFYITQSRPITTLASQSAGSGAEYFRTLKIHKKGSWSSMPLDAETWHNKDTSRYFEARFGIWKEILAICVFDSEYINHMCTPVFFEEKLHAHIRKLTSADKKAMEKLFLMFYDDKKIARKEIPKINPTNITALSDSELAEVYRVNRDWAHRVVLYDQLTWLAEDYWPPLMDEILVGKLGLVKDSSEYIDILFTLIKPREISTTLEEKRAVLEKVLSIYEGKETLQKAAEQLAADYGWMPVLTYGIPWKADKYKQELQETVKRDRVSLKKEFKELKHYTHLRDEGFAKVVSKYNLSEDDLQIFIDFGLAIDTRNEAEYINSIAGFHMLPLYDEMLKRLKLNIFELRSLFEEEIIACLKEGKDPRAFLAAKGRVVAWGITAEKTRVNFTPEQGEEVLAQVDCQNMPSTEADGSAKRGITANRGKVQGIVRLVPLPDDNHKVEQGDILFAYSTMVDNLPAMKKAAAIVTESGGLTCHAAVVAREFGIPCIVGLKGAMAMFQDGDLVEVDAEKGVVRKIKGI